MFEVVYNICWLFLVFLNLLENIAMRSFFYDLTVTLQSPVGPFMKGIIEFHGYIWIFLLFVATFVLLFLLHIILSALGL